MSSRFTARSAHVALATAAAVTLAITATACDSGSDTAAREATPVSSEASGPAQRSPAKLPQAEATSDQGGAQSGSPQAGGSSTGDDAGKGFGQVCGASDLTLTATPQTQAGGYLLISAKAHPGVTCALPAQLPGIAFGSAGIEAGPAEQAVGSAVTLSGSATAYAGVNPKTTNDDNGVEFNSVIVFVGDEDPSPASVPIKATLVDKPVVTNWHTSAAEAVPGN